MLGLTRANGPVLCIAVADACLQRESEQFSNPLVAFATNDVVTGNYVGCYEERNGRGNCRRRIRDSYYTCQDHFSSPILHARLEQIAWNDPFLDWKESFVADTRRPSSEA